MLDAVHAGLLLCDEQCRLLLANQVCKAVFRRAGIDVQGKTCHGLFSGSGTVCEDCPHANGSAGGKQHSLTLKTESGDIYLKVYCHSWLGNRLLTMQDVSQEIGLLRQTDLDRKELHAKNILLERRRRLNAEEQEFLAQLMDHLPDSLITVDEGLRVQRHNRAAVELLPGDGRDFCYSFLGRSTPCEGCPAKYGFAQTVGKKKSHEVNGQYYTEIFTVSPKGKGGLLLFRDITRQVQLIGQIKDFQDEIAQKNNVLSMLVDFGTYLQKESNVQAVVDYFFDTVLPMLHSRGGAIVVNDVRAGNLWISEQRGVEAGDLKKLNKACLARGMQQKSGGQMVADSELPWPQAMQLPLLGASGQRVGLIVLEGEVGGETRGMLRLIIEPLGSYLQNQLLRRQLEEKANTDSLTGLYNRGYLSQALEEEIQKFRQYGINFAVVQVDINMLKKVNDLYGHDIGDQLIIVTANALKETLRNTDIAARTGGDEFIILLTDSTDAEAGHFVERLQEQVFQDLTLMLPLGEPFPVTVSLGKAGSDKYAPESLVKEADRLMYAAKQKFYESSERYR